MGAVHNGSIDIVVPSFRVDEATLLNIIQLKQPDDFTISIFIVIDNPSLNIPASLKKLAEQGAIQLIVNAVNLGFSPTRNKGIRQGEGQWVLLLDDDILADPQLLITYAEACRRHPDAIGFFGSTQFPEPFNNATLALMLNGSTGQFTAAQRQSTLMWAPTANVLLNRAKMDPALFDTALQKGGEDIEFLVRNALRNNQQYIAVPEARVQHPWWDEGRIQWARMYRYGGGFAQIAQRPAIKPFTYYNFTNTSETFLLLVLLAPAFIACGSLQALLHIALSVVISEVLTNWLKALYLSKKGSFALGLHLFLVKNTYELGVLMQQIRDLNVSGFGRRIDTGFKKPHPGWFRLNKWIITKTILLALLLLFYFL